MKVIVGAAACAMLLAGFQGEPPPACGLSESPQTPVIAVAAGVSSVPPGEWRDGPRGLYFMQWYDVVSRSLERHVYLFDGNGYLKDPSGDGKGGIDADPAGARGSGRWSLSGDRMTVSPSQGRPRTARIRLEAATGCFEFDDEVWCPARPFATAVLDGTYSGGSSYTSSFGSAATASDYAFSPDGTYTVLSAGTFNGPEGSSDGRVSGTASTRGTYRAEGMGLTLTADDGTVRQGIAFPFGENIGGSQPSHLFFAGRMLSRRDR